MIQSKKPRLRVEAMRRLGSHPPRQNDDGERAKVDHLVLPDFLDQNLSRLERVAGHVHREDEHEGPERVRRAADLKEQEERGRVGQAVVGQDLPRPCRILAWNVVGRNLLGSHPRTLERVVAQKMRSSQEDHAGDEDGKSQHDHLIRFRGKRLACSPYRQNIPSPRAVVSGFDHVQKIVSKNSTTF